MKQLLLLALAALLPLFSWAHGDEDHSAPTALPPTVSVGPRFATDTDQFELVGVLDGQVLTLYLDQFASNEPVAKAQIEIERGTWKALAAELSPGVYSLAAPALAQPGKHVLTVTVQAGDKSDLLNATLDVGAVNAASAGAPRAGRPKPALLGWGAGALLLAAIGLVTVRLAQQRRLRQASASDSHEIP